MNDQAISPLRRRLIEDMTIRRLNTITRHQCIRHVKKLRGFRRPVCRQGHRGGCPSLPTAPGVARNDLLGQNQRAPRIRIGSPLYALFVLPTATAAFLFSQYFLKLVPADMPGKSPDACNTFARSGYLFDFRHTGFLTKYCIGNLPVDGMPWIYPPYQTYGYILLILGCAYLSYVLCRDWRKYR